MEIKNETSLTYKQLSKVALDTKRHKIIKTLMLLYGSSFVYQFFSIYTSSGEIDALSIGFILFVLFYLIWVPLRTKSLYKNYCGNSNFSVSVTFKDDDFTLSTNTGNIINATGTLKYETISKVDIRKEYIVLYISKMEFIPLDKKNFRSEEEMNEVITIIKSRIKN